MVLGTGPGAGKVGVELAARGRSATAVDMAGHGLGARRPLAALARPFDPATFATEPSPIAAVSLDAAGDLLVSQLKVIGGGRPALTVTVELDSSHSPFLSMPERVAEIISAN
jgi:hypothetical protein